MLRFAAKSTKCSGCYFSFVGLGLSVRAFPTDRCSEYILKQAGFCWRVIQHLPCGLYSFSQLCLHRFGCEFAIIKDLIIILR